MEATSESNEPDFYGILNVPVTASNEEIQKAYKALSKTFHPDRLRARHDAATAELAQETFVHIKTAHDILCDPVYRFVYDQYGHEGVKFLRHCQQQKEGQKAQQQQHHQRLQLPLDVHLYDKLHVALVRNNKSINTSLNSMAVHMLKEAMERYRRQSKQLQQRIRDSAFYFDATLELPCAYHPYGAVAANEHHGRNNNILPYLELEQAHMDFTMRTSNRRTPTPNNGNNGNNKQQQQPPQQQQQQPQNHIYNTTVGTNTEWEANGKANAEVSLGVDYQASPTAKTQWSCEVRAPISKIPTSNKLNQQQQQQQQEQARPYKLSLSTTHEFLSGTAANVGIRGSNVSRDSWEYFITSFRKLSIGNNTTYGRPLQPNIRASFAMGMRVLQQKPLYAFVALNSIPPTQEQQQQQQQQQEQHKQQQNSLASLLHLSKPEVQVRAGYHPSPLHASIKYEEFLMPWMSLFASWSWSLAHQCSKVKVLLSTDLWGFWKENDSTTLRTGIRHDLVSGWIWLLEWEELDWQLKIPISLAISKNNPWMIPATGVMVSQQADMLHYSIAAVLASYVSIKVARSILSDWQGESALDQQNSERAQQSHDPNRTFDATRSDYDRGQDSYDSYEENGDASDESKRRHDTFHQSYIVPVAQKKREREHKNNGLVLLFARVMNTQKSIDAWNEGDLESFHLNSTALLEHDITEILQFWVNDGKLVLPPLSTQTASHYYAFGGPGGTDEAPEAASSWPFKYLSSNEWKRKAQHWVDILKHSRSRSDLSHQTQHTLVIRYEYDNQVYEISMGEDERIVLPSPEALCMGKAGRVK